MSAEGHFVGLALVLLMGGSPGCARTDGPELEVIPMRAEGERVMGKAGLDLAAAGHWPFKPLASEAPSQTLVRAGERITALEAELIVLRDHRGPREPDANALASAATLLRRAKAQLAAIGPEVVPTAAQAESAAALVAEAQQGLAGVQQRQVNAAN